MIFDICRDTQEPRTLSVPDVLLTRLVHGQGMDGYVAAISVNRPLPQGSFFVAPLSPTDPQARRSRAKAFYQLLLLQTLSLDFMTLSSALTLRISASALLAPSLSLLLPVPPARCSSSNFLLNAPPAPPAAPRRFCAASRSSAALARVSRSAAGSPEEEAPPRGLLVLLPPEPVVCPEGPSDRRCPSEEGLLKQEPMSCVYVWVAVSF